MRISPSALNLFKDCPRCFWLDRVAKCPRPPGIKASLPNGIDAVLKAFYDSHRKAGTKPPEVEDIPGRLFQEQGKLDRWRNWMTGPVFRLGSTVVTGALDDVWDNGDGTFSPFDFKTKGTAPTAGYAERYYMTQGSVYELLLQGEGMKTNGKAVFAFYSPRSSRGLGVFEFDVTIVEMKTDIETSKVLIGQAVDCLGSSTFPEPTPGCKFCLYRSRDAREVVPE